jgi:hypothetical protein
MGEARETQRNRLARTAAHSSRGLWGVVVLLLSAPAAGALPPMLRDAPNTYDPAKTQALRLRQWDRFNARHGGRWRVEWNPSTGTPHRISGSSLRLRAQPTKRSAVVLARAFLRQHEELLQIRVGDLDLVSLDDDRGMGGRSTSWYVSFRQTHRGVPVAGSAVRVMLRGRKVVAFGADAYPGIRIGSVPAVSRSQAAAAAQAHAGVQAPIDAAAVDLVVLPEPLGGPIRYRLAWRALLPPSRALEPLAQSGPGSQGRQGGRVVPERWLYFIDARSAEVITRINVGIVGDVGGTVTGPVHPAHPTDEPSELPISDLSVTVTDTTSSSMTTVVTDDAGQWRLATAGSSTIPGAAYRVVSLLSGPHAFVQSGESDVALHQGAFATNVEGVGIHSWSWEEDDRSPDHVETSAFYHINAVHRWFQRGDPFDILPWPYPMPVLVRDGGYCNAYSDASGLRFGHGAAECDGHDFALCSDIIYHEYVHRIVHALYPDPLLFPYIGQTGAMDEAFADYFACAFTNDPQHGEECYAGRNIGEPDKRYPDDWVGEVHDDSPILSGALWDLRDLAPGLDVDSLALRAMKNTPLSFSEYLGTVIEEDDNSAFSPDPAADDDASNGSPHDVAICSSFYDGHGIFHPHCFGHTTGPLAAITSPAPMVLNYHRPSAGALNVRGTAAGGAQPLASYDLAYEAHSSAGSWTTIAEGGSPVDDGILGVWDASALDPDLYTLRLTVTDASGASRVATVRVSLDDALRPGWPVLVDRPFFSPPATGNLDVSTPELEIVANSWDRVYVFDASGHVLPPWPKLLPGGTFSAPAVGDLDGDGQLDIVCSSATGLRAWHHDGSEMFTLPYGPALPGFLADPVNLDSSPALQDLDGDGDLEIVVGSLDGGVYIVHHRGDLFASDGFTWPKRTAGAIQTTPALADIDGDHRIEVVVGSHDGMLHAWNLDGTPVAGLWPLTIGYHVISSPAIGDIDNDGGLEIVHGADDGAIHAWNHDGSSVAGAWPFELTSIPLPTWSSPALADLDGNGDLEILASGDQRHMEALDHDGTRFPGWDRYESIQFMWASPVVGDIYHNPGPEVAAATNFFEEPAHWSPFNRLVVFGADGSPVDGIAGYIDGLSIYGTPLITDLERDGRPEIVVGSGLGLFVWTLGPTPSSGRDPWPTFHQNMQRSGVQE